MINSELKQFVNTPANGVETRVFTITPDDATMLLERNTDNRPISKAVINRYADVMSKGGWYLNGLPIIFDENGKLTDGQHRLMAVVESGCSIDTLVTIGVAADAFASYDCGRSRTLGQLIGMSGVASYNAVAAVVRGYDSLKRDLRSYVRGRFILNDGNKLTNDELIRIYNADTETFNLFGVRAQKLANNFKKAPLTGTLGATIWLYLVKDMGYEDDFVGEFFDQIYNEMPTTTSKTLRAMCMKFRNWRNSTAKLPTTLMVDYLVRAWNYYAIGKEVANITLPNNGKHPSFISAENVLELK